MPADPEAVAYWEQQLTDALASHDDDEAVLAAAKAACDAACAEAQVAVLAEPSEDNHMREELAHQTHKAQLEAAYRNFGRAAVAERNLKRARFGLSPEGASNPATPGVVTPIEAHIEASAEVASS